MPLSSARAAAAFISNGLRALRPAPILADARERLRVVAGATMGILITALLCHPVAAVSPWLVAPLGASAVLVFGVPGSPLAQPWAVVGGNTLSALVGAAVVHWGGPTELAAALAVGGAIALMFALRCLHPPGGASALLAVMTGVTDWRFALFPVALNSMLLVAAGVVYNRATGRPYPHPQALPPPTARDDEARAIDAELDAVLRRYNQVLDVPRDDLKALLHDVQLGSYRRKLADTRCRDIMSPDPVTVSIRTPLAEAQALFARHQVKALPVVDAHGGIVGIVTRGDCLRDADAPQPPQAVGQVMTRRVRVASAERHLVELIPLFSSTGHHHLPIVDGADRLVGMVTESDVVRALAAPALGPPAPR